MADGKTPIGADRSEILLFDASGARTDDPNRAVTAEIIEYAGDVQVQRTYLNRGRGAGRPTAASRAPEWTPPGDVVDEPDVADATKNTWDVTVMVGGQVRFVETLPDLLLSLGVADAPEAEQKAAVETIRPLPSWAAAPPALRTVVDDWLGGPATEGWMLDPDAE
jgi:hypothetical protein